jgi:hypothetical protein
MGRLGYDDPRIRPLRAREHRLHCERLVIPQAWLTMLWAVGVVFLAYAVANRHRHWILLATPVAAILLWIAVVTLGRCVPELDGLNGPHTLSHRPQGRYVPIVDGPRAAAGVPRRRSQAGPGLVICAGRRQLCERSSRAFGAAPAER